MCSDVSHAKTLGEVGVKCGLWAGRRSQKVEPERRGLGKLTWLRTRLVWTGMWAPAKLLKSGFHIPLLGNLTSREKDAAMGVHGSEIKQLGAKRRWTWIWKVSDNGQGTRHISSPGQAGSTKGIKAGYLGSNQIEVQRGTSTQRWDWRIRKDN